MGRLIKQSNFNTFELSIQTPLKTLVSVLRGEIKNIVNQREREKRYKGDTRLNIEKVVLYSGNNIFGGVYKESGVEGEEIKKNLFAIEGIAFNNVVDTNEKGNSFIVEGYILGVVATNIYCYDEITKKMLDPSLIEYARYCEVFPNFSSIIDARNFMSTNVTLEGITFDYVAPSFQEACRKLNLI